jgi:hypothetical protein
MSHSGAPQNTLLHIGPIPITHNMSSTYQFSRSDTELSPIPVTLISHYTPVPINYEADILKTFLGVTQHTECSKI